jgi:hypothetical protein
MGLLVNAQNTNLGDHGKLLRLIVVGINSFNAQGSYTGNGNGTDAHIVFQFQNLPVLRRMEATPTNEYGYLGSEMRKYLVPVDGVSGSGKFLAGLYAAGVPQDVLWAPARRVANRGVSPTAADPIQDRLWLPTEREMFGNCYESHDTWETAVNQARLEYYDAVSKWIKYNNSNAAQFWWEASPSAMNVDFFAVVDFDGNAYNIYALAAEGGCAPAFCVK